MRTATCIYRTALLLTSCNSCLISIWVTMVIIDTLKLNFFVNLIKFFIYIYLNFRKYNDAETTWFITYTVHYCYVHITE